MKDKKLRAKAKKLANNDRYYLYQDLLSEVIVNNRSRFENLQGIRQRGADPIFEFSKVFSFDKGPIENHSGLFHMLSYDNLLLKEGIPTIFPQSVGLIEQLYKAKFSSPEKLQLIAPFKNFTIAMPKGIKVAGYDMPGFAVSYGTKHENFDIPVNEALTSIYPEYEIERTPIFDAADKEMEVAIRFKSPVTKTHIIERLDTNLFHILLKSKSLEQFEKLKSEYLDKNEIDRPSDKNIVRAQSKDQMSANELIIYSAFKMFATLCVYLSSTKESRMVEGLPSEHVKQVRSNESLLRSSQNFLIKSSPEIEYISKLNLEKSPHYRGMHFRNLLNDKFYKGEFKDWEKGTRWTEVSGSLVGINANPKTIIDDSPSI